MAYETRETYKLGFIEETDADQVDLLVANLEATLINLKNQINIAYAQLKYTLGMNDKDSIKCIDNLNSLLSNADFASLVKNIFQGKKILITGL